MVFVVICCGYSEYFYLDNLYNNMTIEVKIITKNLKNLKLNKLLLNCNLSF